MKTNHPEILYSDAVDKLIVLCGEVMRATPEHAKNFVEPSPGVLASATSRQHNLVFGRRGSGKSSLLRRTAADLTLDRRPIAFVDMETFKGHTYPDVLISVLIKSLREFEKWIAEAATTPASKTSFWRRFFGTTPNRPPFKKQPTSELLLRLQKIISELELQLAMAETSDVRVKRESSKQRDTQMSTGAQLEIGAVGAKANVGQTDRDSASDAYEASYVSHKVEYLHRHILEFQRFFEELGTLSDGASFLILDDLYHIRKQDQAKVIDYFHRVAKGNGLWLKIGTIRHRSNWYQHSDPPMGIKLGDDAKEINLDMSLESFGTLKRFLKKILTGLLDQTPPLKESALLAQSTFDRLMIASGGVTRDFIGILNDAILQARERGNSGHRGPKVGAEDVNIAAGKYDSNKREEFKVDADTDRDRLEKAFKHLAEFCKEKSHCNVFLIPQALEGETKDSINQLVDLRLVHPVKSRVTLKRGKKGELFEAYMLDLSQYSASRKVRGFQILNLSSSAKDEDMRKASLIYDGT